MLEEEKVIEAVKQGFIEKLANIDNVLAYSDGAFCRMASDYVDNRRWVKLLDDEVDDIIAKNVEGWVDTNALTDLEIEVGRCPKCQEVRVLDALARNNEDDICTPCGEKEALEDLGYNI